ncbi:C6 transcription factor [Marssonina coronariae]|uniref:C6 transcription factor n=1 Tax=Diplocarpon coronariae TaxID=2795749 RepID=A0A218Z8T7_9HELO|nr:C6 transcription factor [Marssonina coronariae]
MSSTGNAVPLASSPPPECNGGSFNFSSADQETGGWKSGDMGSKKQKPGPKAGAGQDLADKIRRLESVVQALSQQLESHICGPIPAETAFQRISPPLVSSNSAGSNASSAESSIAHAVRSVSLTSAKPWRHQSHQSLARPGSTSASPSPSIEHELRAFTPVTPPTSSSSPGTTVGWPSETVEPALPPPQQLYVLVDLYFKHINTWIPMLDRVTTFNILSQPRTPVEADRILLHAIVMISLRFSTDPSHTEEARLSYRHASKRRVQFYALDCSDIRTLQALVLLAVDMLGCSHRPETSNMLAWITQSILNFRLGLETDHSAHPSRSSPSSLARAFMLPPPRSWTENEERRRLFWVVYSMDRYATLGTGSRFSIEERAAKRRLPCRYDIFSDDRAVETRWPRWDGGYCNSEHDTLRSAASLGSYSYHCELLKIITQTHEFLRKPVQIDARREIDDWRRRYSELDRWLSTWLCSLPGEYSEISQFCHSDTKSKISNWIILQAAFVVAVISLHTAAAYPYPPSRLFRPSYNAMQKCLGAVSSLKELTVDVVNTGMLDLLGPGFPFALWMASRILLVHASIKGHPLDPNILFFMETLSQLGKYWPIARTYRVMLDSVLQEHGENSATGIFQKPSITEKLGDMRRSAYSLHVAMLQNENLEQQSSTSTELTEIELLSIDIFGTFNQPTVHSNFRESTMSIDNIVSEDFDIPDPSQDWFPLREDNSK